MFWLQNCNTWSSVEKKGYYNHVSDHEKEYDSNNIPSNINHLIIQ